MKKLLVLLIAAVSIVAGCSSEKAPVAQDGTQLVVVKHKVASGTTVKHHHKKAASSAIEAAQMGS